MSHLGLGFACCLSPILPMEAWPMWVQHLPRGRSGAVLGGCGPVTGGMRVAQSEPPFW